MDYLYVGKLVNTHGIKGEVRLLSKFRYKNKVFIKNFKVYIGKDKEEFIIESYRVHKNFDMLVFKDNYNINNVERLKGALVYINKNDLILDDNTFLSQDLINYTVLIDKKEIGKVIDILDTPANEVLVLDNNIMIPYVKDFIKDINTSKNIIEVNNIKGLI